MFQPDVLLPTQFFAAMRKRVPKEAEYRLVLAVLQDAVECYQKHFAASEPKAYELFADAEAWIASDDRSWPYSFINICELLNISPAYVREGLRAWGERQGIERKRGAASLAKCADSEGDQDEARLDREAS
jgi:hypothetical protein